jgi:hypothetical protein
MTVTTEIETTRKLLEATDTDIAAFFDYFSDDCVFRMGNNAPVIGKSAIESWVSQYLTSVSMRHESSKNGRTATWPRFAWRSPTPCRTVNPSPSQPSPAPASSTTR